MGFLLRVGSPFWPGSPWLSQQLQSQPFETLVHGAHLCQEEWAMSTPSSRKFRRKRKEIV